VRAALVLLLVLTIRLNAETLEDKLEVIGGQWRIRDDGRSVEILPFDHVRLWVNGADVSSMDEFVIRAGDNVDVWGEPTCYRYRFESITSAGVLITRCTFVSVATELDENRTRKQSGRLLKKETIHASAAQLPMLIWEDLPNGVETGPVGIYRSKGATK
jgi:hypothetical protein